MKSDDDELVVLLKDAGLPPDVIADHLPALRRFGVELKAREIEFWGKYFIRSADHYRKHHKRRHG
jgi:hypothetical protein